MTTPYNLDLTVRIGCHLVYETVEPTPILLVVRPRPDAPHRVMQEKLTFRSEVQSQQFTDSQGNLTHRWVLPPGQTIIHHDALVAVSSIPDDADRPNYALPIEQLPPDVLRYTLPSRYCDSDKILAFAAQQFGSLQNVLDRVIAVCNWTHWNIRYVTGSGRPDIAASEIMARRYGVCRDFAHVGVALCRALNIPARYVTGHLPDIGVRDPGTPMDFHAYFEAYLGQQWCIFDARFNAPRIGRVKIAHGLDAADAAFATTFGSATLAFFEAWAYQVNPAVVSLDDPIDLSKRLDGTPQIRFN